MKATELMIGDWVGRVFDDKRIIEDYRQVDWIRTGEIGMQYQKVWSIGCIEPIPLTREILEKNDLPQYQWLKIYFQGEYGNITDFSKRINYVHELQHALRLCGLNDLADNFKV